MGQYIDVMGFDTQTLTLPRREPLQVVAAQLRKSG